MGPRAAAASSGSTLVRALVLALAGCGGSDVELFVDLQTDLAPGSQFVAARPDVASELGDVAPIEELNTGFVDDDPWVSGDSRYIMFSSDRSGTLRLYEASR